MSGPFSASPGYPRLGAPARGNPRWGQSPLRLRSASSGDRLLPQGGARKLSMVDSLLRLSWRASRRSSAVPPSAFLDAFRAGTGSGAGPCRVGARFSSRFQIVHWPFPPPRARANTCMPARPPARLLAHCVSLHRWSPYLPPRHTHKGGKSRGKGPGRGGKRFEIEGQGGSA
jgi:hypothetical protein